MSVAVFVFQVSSTIPLLLRPHFDPTYEPGEALNRRAMPHLSGRVPHATRESGIERRSSIIECDE
jgi:hypothetical protein